MDCGRCGTPNPETNKFCSDCGAALGMRLDPVLQSAIDKKIDTALASKLTDQRIVEIDVQEKVIVRLTALAKIVGIPIALLLALLSLWGIKSLSDVDSKVKQATDDAVKNAIIKMNTKVDTETERAIASLKKKVDDEDAEIVQQAKKSAKASLDTDVDLAKKEIEMQAQGSKKRFDDLRSQVEKQAANLTAAVNAQDAKLGKLEGAVNRLTAQQIGLKFEGVILQPYQDQSNTWWIGSGHPLTAEEVATGKMVIDGKQVDIRAGITPEQATQLLQQDLNSMGEKIDKLVTVKLTNNQKGALEDFVLNMGVTSFANGTMLKELNAGNYDAVPEEMMKWTKIGGHEIAAYKRRREFEVELWRTP